MANSNFADLHCHPHFRAFNFLRNSRHRFGPRYHPWTVILSNFKQQSGGGRGFSYSQCDLVKLKNGCVRVVFASLYPFEKGFFQGGGKIDGQFVQKAARALDKAVLPGVAFRALVKPILSSEEGVTSAKDYFQSLLMRMPVDRINFIQSSKYDYFDELQEEYNFLVSRSGVETEGEVFGPWLKRATWKLFHRIRLSGKKGEELRKSTEGKGTYVVARSWNDVNKAMADGHMAFIVTIEGMLALGTDRYLSDVMKRIEMIKKWDFPVFFITFAHHFNNNLCGHARSLPTEARLFCNQEQGMHAPFSALGIAAARYLLSLDENNVRRDTLGRRVLIDVKHMGATARRQYYDDIVRPCLQKGDVIPVLASHVGYSGVETLADLEASYDKEVTDYQVVTGLNAWNINVCDEDIEVIIQTGGLLGFNFDQRIAGQLKKKKEWKIGIELLWNNLRGMLDAVNDSTKLSHAEKVRFWDILTLGTDFEGYIDPLNEYPTALACEKLRTDLISLIQRTVIGAYPAPPGATAETLADKICFGNVMDFLKKHF